MNSFSARTLYFVLAVFCSTSLASSLAAGQIAARQEAKRNAGEPASGLVDGDVLRNRIAGSTRFDGLQSSPWNSYEERRKRLERDYNYKPDDTPLTPLVKSQQAVPDFSSERTIVSPNADSDRPDSSSPRTLPRN